LDNLHLGIVAVVAEHMDRLKVPTCHAVALRLLSGGHDFSTDLLRKEIADLLQADGIMNLATAEAYLRVYQIRFILHDPDPFA